MKKIIGLMILMTFLTQPSLAEDPLVSAEDQALIDKINSTYRLGEEGRGKGLNKEEACKETDPQYLIHCLQGFFVKHMQQSATDGTFSAYVSPDKSESEKVKIAWASALGMAMATLQDNISLVQFQALNVPELLQEQKYKKYYMEGWAYSTYQLVGYDGTVASCQKYFIQNNICLWGMGEAYFAQRSELAAPQGTDREFIAGYLYARAHTSTKTEEGKDIHAAVKMANYVKKTKFEIPEKAERTEQQECFAQTHIAECVGKF